MTFAQPWALLSLLSLPILIYLYRLRPKREDAVVSSVMFWHEAVKIRDSRRNFHRILRDLNLWLLLALALLLGIAVANPQWQVTARQSQDSVLIIDISASMGARSNALGRTRFDEAKAKAGQIIDALPDGGRLLVMTSARYARAQSGFEADRDRLHAIVARLEVTQQSGRPQAAFALARTLLRSREQAQLHFITDGAFDTDLGLVTSASERHLVGDQRANVAITRFDIRPALHSDDEYEVFLAIRNFGQQSIEAPVRISMDASVLVERNITVEGQREVSLALPMSGRLGTRAQARIAVDDALDVDNAAFMAFASPAPRQIVLFTPGNFYLETALRELPGTLVDVRTEADESAMRAAMRGYDIAVFDRITPPALKTGNFLLVDVAPADTEFHVPQRLSATTVTGTGDSALVRGLDLSKVRVGAPRNMQLRTSPSVQRLFWSADADLGVSTLHPGRRAVYLSFDLLDSNFPRQTAFPLFIRRAVQWLAASSIATYSQAGQTALVRDSRERRRQVPVGESFTLELAPGTEEISIATPDGSAEVVALTSPRYTFTETAKAGLYRYTAAGVTHYIAANLTDENESDINRRAPDQPTVAASQRVTQKGIVKFALWPYFAWTALILLMAEWWVWSMRREHA